MSLKEQYISDTMLETLDHRNIELSKILFSLKQSIDLEKIIGLNADTINKEGIGKRFFSHVQTLSQESCIMSIYKIFEKEKKHSLNSIPAILKFIKTNKINPKYFEPINEFITKYGVSSEEEKDYIKNLENICSSFYAKHRISLERYDYARDKVVAHTEYKANVKTIPSHAVMKELLLFGIDFSYMINKAYLNIGPYPIDKDERMCTSFKNLFKKLGIENIKTDFDK